MVCSQHSTANISAHFRCFPCGGLSRRTPGPPPFSSMNSTPAISKARRTARSLAAVMDVSLSASGSNLTLESRIGFPSDLPTVVVGFQATISRFVVEANDDPKPFTWLADPNKSIVAVRRGYQVLDSIHLVVAQGHECLWRRRPIVER